MPQIQFDLVSPERKILSEAVTMAVIPATEGDIGVMAGHAPMVVSLRPGIVAVYHDNASVASDYVFIAGGFADITGGVCTVLAERAERVADIDLKAVSERIAALDGELNGAELPEAEQKRLRRERSVLMAMRDCVAAVLSAGPAGQARAA